MHTVVGLFDHYMEADRAVNALQEYGIEGKHINVVTRDSEDVRSGANAAGAGAATGAAAGGVVGLLAGLSALIIPGIGPVIATGAIASALATTLGMTAVGAGIGAAAGGLLGALVHVGFSQDDAEFYAEGVKRGGVLVFVETETRDEGQVTVILRDAGAVDVNSRRKMWQDEGWTRYEENERQEVDTHPRNPTHY
jgi:uncharacterized membrane protein